MDSSTHKNSVINLISNRFTSYTYEQKLEIKQLGRPTPDLKGLINKAKKGKNEYIMNEEKFKRIEKICLKKLDLEQIVNSNPLNTQKIRSYLREREFECWKDLKQKGKGVELFAEYTPGNKNIMDKVGLSESEWKDCIKMFANVVPVRVLHGRSQGSNRCRHACGEIETLAHVLGFCRFGELLRNTRHHTK